MIREDQVQQMQMSSINGKQVSSTALGGSIVPRKKRSRYLSCHTEQLLEQLQNSLQEKV